MRDLIRDALEHQARGECPDAALLAAYADRTLDRIERDAVVAHLAGCDRCRETLILMSRAAQAEASAAAAARSSRGAPFLLRRWPWLAGAAAAGLAVVIWTSVQPRDRRQALPEPPTEAAAKTAAPPPAAPQPSANAPADVARDERRRDAGAARNKAEHLLADRVEKTPAPEARAGAKAVPPPAAPPAPVAEIAMTAEKPAAKPQTVGQTAGRAAPSGVRESARAAYDTVAVISAAAPGGRTVWRVSGSGVIERSADAGVTWTRESAVEAAGARAIAAPSADVCWIVGQAGLILRYEPARGWTRVRAPAEVDFVGITAVDARQATVTAADDRRFSTADGGETWK